MKHRGKIVLGASLVPLSFALFIMPMIPTLTGQWFAAIVATILWVGFLMFMAGVDR